MTWEDFYLVCFVVGFAFSFFSFLSGGLRWHPHWPHGLGHLGHAGSGPATAHAAPTHGGGTISPINFVTLTAFLAWFGGTGYLITRYSRLWLLAILLLATVSGLAGSAMVFGFLRKLMTSLPEESGSSESDLVGVLGRVSSPVREGGTGEIVFTQAGTRHTCGARCEDGRSLAKGLEVVVTRYEKGIAYVRPWDEVVGDGEAR